MTKEEIKNEIAEHEQKLSALRKELEKSECAGKRWKPKTGEKYYYVSLCGEVRRITNYESLDDNGRLLIGDCFKNKEEAEFALERLKVIAELSDYAEGDEAVWDDETTHWLIYYNTVLNYMSVAAVITSRTSQLYFPSEEAAKAAVKAVGEERVKRYYLGVK